MKKQAKTNDFNSSGNHRPLGRLDFPKNQDSKGVPPLVAGRGSESPAREIQFNIVIAGVGGQGLITLLKVIAEAAKIEDCEVKTSELHGLSQRGGSVEVHIRFGKEIYSPLIKEGGADLIISLEAQESLKSCYYASKEEKTAFLVNNFFSPIQEQAKTLSDKEISVTLRKFSPKIIMIAATKICQEKLANPVVAGIFLLGYANYHNLIPLKNQSLTEAMKKVVPEKFLELNERAFELAKNYEKE